MSTLRKIVQIEIRSFFWSVFTHIRTEYGEIRNKTPYLDTFHTVEIII